MIREILTFIVIFIILLSNFSLADEIDLEELDISTIEASTYDADFPKTNSKYALVLERSTGTVLFEKNGYSRTPMASTTKIMTAIIAIENSDLSDMVTISKKAANTGGSTLGISANTQISMNTLLYGLLMRSGNDCAVAIAEHISGNIENFAKIMNEKAFSLGLKNTHFVTPHGLDAENHFTSAYDLAIITNYALNNSTFSNIVKNKTATITIDNIQKSITNTHELLGYTEGVYGVKTGFTGNAGRCLVTACKRNNLDIIIIVLGADTKKNRTVDTLNLINYIYKNFEMTNTESYLYNNFKPIEYSIKNSLEKTNLYLEKNTNYIFPINKNNKNFKLKYYILENQFAPLKKDSKIGILQFWDNDILLYENNILLKKDIKQISISEYFYILIEEFNNMFR